MEKILQYTIVILLVASFFFGGGFLIGRITANTPTISSGSDNSGQVARIVELTREYLTRERASLTERERILTTREGQLNDREERLKREREALLAESGDASELKQIITKIGSLSQTSE